MTFDEYKRAWDQAFKAAGHTYVCNDDGEPDRFRVDYGYHNGPECSSCGWSCCEHCTGPGAIPQCTHPATSPSASIGGS